VIGCWLASRAGDPERAYDELQVLWQQAAQSAEWPRAPETDAQAEFVRNWRTTVTPHEAPERAAPVVTLASRADRIRGAMLGLAVGDAVGAAKAAKRVGGLAYTQPTALALCLATSLLDCGRFDARDQVQRYLRWEREGYCAADGKPGTATPDVALALGTSLWRGMTMAGSHDPKDRSTASLSRAIATAVYGARDPAAAVALAAESSRPTHQAPVILDACRLVAAMVIAALAGAPIDQVLTGQCEPVAGLWAARPLKKEFTATLAAAEGVNASTAADASGDLVLAIARARRVVRAAADFETALRRAGDHATDPAPLCALTGALFGALHGVSKIPEARLKSLAGAEQVERVAAALAAHDAGPGA
jgi:ADP-ribosylglycohydrolase